MAGGMSETLIVMAGRTVGRSFLKVLSLLGKPIQRKLFPFNRNHVKAFFPESPRFELSSEIPTFRAAIHILNFSDYNVEITGIKYSAYLSLHEVLKFSEPVLIKAERSGTFTHRLEHRLSESEIQQILRLARDPGFLHLKLECRMFITTALGNFEVSETLEAQPSVFVRRETPEATEARKKIRRGKRK